jgi:xylitol oxidase
MTREHNWADNHTFSAGRIHRPASIDEVRRLVARSPRIHAVGARHSFNGVADSPGELIDLRDIDPGFRIDPEHRTVTVGAATNYGVLAAHLHRMGWALHNMASLPHVSVAGAVATGTHGSGDRLGNLATAVAALEIVCATGDVTTIRRGDPGFDGVVVALGALGIVTRVTLDIEPAFTMRQDAFEGLPWATLLAELDAVMSAGYSVSLFTTWSGPTVTRWWIKTRLEDGTPDAMPAARFGAALAAHPPLLATEEAMQRINPFGVAGPWSERLPHFRLDVEPNPARNLQSEYMVPRAQASTAIARLREIGDRIDRHLSATEIRSMTGDALWLSPSFGDDRISIHFSWLRESQAVAALTAEIEEMLLPLGGRRIGGRSSTRARPTSCRSIRNCLRFVTWPVPMTPTGNSATSFSTRMCSGDRRLFRGGSGLLRDASKSQMHSTGRGCAPDPQLTSSAMPEGPRADAMWRRRGDDVP